MREIPLTRGLVALVDDEDFDRLSVFNWRARRVRSGAVVNHYAIRTACGGRSGIDMHMQWDALRVPRATLIDHRNGDGLDNRRSNLRLATVTENNRNARKRARTTSVFKGVSWRRSRGLWRAQIQVAGRPRDLGCFAVEVDAAERYDAAARELFGEFAAVNFPVGEERGALTGIEARRP